MGKPRRYLEFRGGYDIPLDNLYVVRPDTVDRSVPNLSLGSLDYSRNPNYGLSTGVGYNMHGELIDYYDHGRLVSEQEAKQRAKAHAIESKKSKPKEAFNKYVSENKYKDGGSINIAPSKRGTFTAAATKHGMTVSEFANKVLKNKDDYSPSLIKKANFARNASKWNK